MPKYIVIFLLLLINIKAQESMEFTEFIDIDFDGKKDLIIKEGEGCYLDDFRYNVYLFRKNGYIKSPKFDKIFNDECYFFDIDKDKKLFYLQKGVANKNSFFTYKVKNKTPKLIELETEELDGAFVITNTTKYEKKKTHKRVVTFDFPVKSLMSFELLNHKKIILFRYGDMLFYAITKKDHKNVEFYYPSYKNHVYKNIDFSLNNQANRLKFVNNSVVYEIYQNKNSVGIAVDTGKKKFDLKGDIGTLKGGLKNISSLIFKNLKSDFIAKTALKNRVFSDINEALKTPQFVLKLNLEDEDLKTFPKDIAKFKNLKVLILAKNKIESVPEFIGELKELKVLDLSSNKITSLPKSITKLTKLTKLDLFSNRLKNLPKDIGKLSNLEELTLTSNQLESIPISFKNLKKLKKLYFSENNLSSLDDSLKELNSVEYLGLSSNNFKKIPSVVGKLTSLLVFNMRKNRITKIPDFIGNLTKLQKLDMTDNKIISISNTISNLQELWELELNNNSLTSLPKDFGKLTKLRRIYLENNNLKTLPKSFINLSNLEILRMPNNQLTKLPDGFGDYKKLYVLEINKNRLKSLPSSFSKLDKLDSLSVIYNELEVFPDFIDKMKNIKDVSTYPKLISNFSFFP